MTIYTQYIVFNKCYEYNFTLKTKTQASLFTLSKPASKTSATVII